MNDYFTWLTEFEKKIPMLYRTLRYFYLTKMSIPWAIAFFTLAVVSWFVIANLYIAYIVFGFSILIGIMISILMIISMCTEVAEVKLLHKLYKDFIDSLKTGASLSRKAEKAFDDFQKLFNRVCPQEPIDIKHFKNIDAQLDNHEFL